jgi:hypothetical protein
MSNTQKALANGLQSIPWRKPHSKVTRGVLMSKTAIATIVKRVPQLGITDLRKRGWYQDRGRNCDWDSDYCLDGWRGKVLVLREHPGGRWFVELGTPDSFSMHYLSYLWVGHPTLFWSPTDVAQVAEEVLFHSDSHMPLYWEAFHTTWS